ncbi:hypothetical protein LDO26_16735 [Luteimonas sp. BDR2-5]|uniref:hypothetical protein n=1 Tax=Proluteimonas luteida TaxID=2878685 RepID=UPI001E3044CC|nr:hypothetical protein [Luteimonas sp. BDR2-5]MCD9029839.1 hypothetical protein [Luteimonas sp. BDR2-5]
MIRDQAIVAAAPPYSQSPKRGKDMAMIRNDPARVAFACILAVAGASCDAAGEAPVAVDAPQVAEAQVLDGLPLGPGFYVRTDAECGAASSATLALVRRDGIGECSFVRIERIAESRYRVEESCRNRQAPPGREHERDEFTQAYEILAEDRYRITFEYGESAEFRFCPQQSLPDPWRGNDISDVTG